MDVVHACTTLTPDDLHIECGGVDLGDVLRFADWAPKFGRIDGHRERRAVEEYDTLLIHFSDGLSSAVGFVGLEKAISYRATESNRMKPSTSHVVL